MKWVFAAGGLAFFGYAVWQYLNESAKVAQAAKRPRQPWDIT